MFTILGIALAVLAILAALFALSKSMKRQWLAIPAWISALLAALASAWLLTHWIVPTQYVGVTRSTISQELDGMYQPGIASRPLLSRTYEYPASDKYERCEVYTPAISGSYGITVDLCFYYDLAKVNWIKEINTTGRLGENVIMDVWRNSVVGRVAEAVKDYTPERLSDNRGEVEAKLFANLKPWFDERGIPLVAISFKNWDFTSSTVGAAFDESIVSQRKIAEQQALYQAAVQSRLREEYEAETARLVATKQRMMLDELGLDGADAVNYLWIKMMIEQDDIPDTVILDTSGVPATVPVK